MLRDLFFRLREQDDFLLTSRTNYALLCDCHNSAVCQFQGLDVILCQVIICDYSACVFKSQMLEIVLCCMLFGNPFQIVYQIPCIYCFVAGIEAPVVEGRWKLLTSHTKRSRYSADKL